MFGFSSCAFFTDWENYNSNQKSGLLGTGNFGDGFCRNPFITDSDRKWRRFAGYEDAAKSCVHLLKGVVGSIGILAAVLTFLPVLLEVGIWYCMVHAVAWLGAILDIGEVSEILSCVAQTFSILLAIVCSFMLMFLVSTTLILTVTAR